MFLSRFRACGLVAAALITLAGCATPPKPATLADRLGGKPGIARIVSDLLDQAVADPRTRRSFDGVKLATLKQSVSAHICQVADGADCGYEGETMARAHADLKIGGGEFEAFVAQLRVALDRQGVDTATKNELLRRLAPMRRDVVTAGPVR